MNGFGHIEIPSMNFTRTKKFFGTVFGWTFEDVPDMDYVLFRAGTRPGGGFVLVKKMPKKGQVNAYIEVEDIEATLKAIRKLRGKVVTKKTEIPAMGWWAQFATPDGCFLFLWQAPPQQTAAQPAAPEQPGA